MQVSVSSSLPITISKLSILAFCNVLEVQAVYSPPGEITDADAQEASSVSSEVDTFTHYQKPLGSWISLERFGVGMLQVLVSRF